MLKYYKIFNKKSSKKIKFKKTGLNQPQIRGTITKLMTMTPKKPNSAIRKIVKVKTSKFRNQLMVYVPGQKHTLAIHNKVLIRNNKIQDLPGINYEIILGKLDAKSPERVSQRSRFSIKKTAIRTKVY